MSSIRCSLTLSVSLTHWIRRLTSGLIRATNADQSSLLIIVRIDIVICTDCARSVMINALWLWIARYWLVLGIVGIVVATFLFFTQHQQSKTIGNLTLIILTVGTTVCLIYVLLYITLFSSNHLKWLGWAVLGVGVIIGLPLSYLTCQYFPIACIVCALPAGTSLAMVLQTAVIYLFNFEYTIYIVIGALCLVTTVGCLMAGDHAINVANAITSSYVMMRCIGLFLDYPFEFSVYFERGEFKTKDRVRGHSYSYNLYRLIPMSTYTLEGSSWVS